MEQLLKIKTATNGSQAVSARELYAFLEVQTQFTIWIERMIEYGFIENQDFNLIIFDEVRLEGNRSVTRKLHDYALTVDCAKQISMLQRNEKGQQARMYFIEVEKAHRAIKPMSDMELLNQAVVISTRLVQEQRAQIAQLAPKAQYAEKVLQSESDWTTTTIAKELNMSATKLNQALAKQKIQYCNSDGVYVLYSAYQSKGYTETRTFLYQGSDNSTRTKIYTVWTEKGREFLHLLFNKKLDIRGGLEASERSVV